MLTLDPSQVCYIHIVVKFAKKMLPLYSFVFFFVLFVICTYHLDQFFMPQHITHVLTFFLKKIQRISAKDALDAEYFWTDPLPCDPKRYNQMDICITEAHSSFRLPFPWINL
jgi:hypothetical protein